MGEEDGEGERGRGGDEEKILGFGFWVLDFGF
jgi:hypothetical protein